MDNGVGKASTGIKEEQKAIDDYLKQVEKNLKGFTREAKDSILIEIREHILDRFEEEREAYKMKGGQGEGEMDTLIKKILEEYGKPEEVARAYSPIIRLSNKGSRLFQGYSLLVSLSFLYVTLPRMEFFKDGFEGEWVLTIVGIIGTFLAYVCIYFNLIYVSNAEEQIKYSRISLYANTLLGAVFLILVFGWYLHLLGGPFMDDTYYLDENEIRNNMAYFGVLAICSIGLSYHISSLGHSMMTQDTKDGIAPYQNISSRVLPFLFVINFLSLIVISQQMWDTFEYLSEWNTIESYWTLGYVIFLTLCTSGILVLHKRMGLKMLHIEREVFAIMLICLVLTSDVAVDFYRENINLQDDWGYWNFPPRGDEDNVDIGYLAYYGMISNGTMYTREITEEDNGYTLTINRWNEDLSGIKSNVSVPIGGNSSDEYIFGLRVQSSGSYIHILYVVRRTRENQTENGNESDKEERDYWHQYLLMDFNGNILHQRRIYIGTEYWGGARTKLLVSGNDATHIRYNYIENITNFSNMNWIPVGLPAHRQYDYLNLSIVHISPEDQLHQDEVNITIPLTNTVGWSRYIPSVHFFKGAGTIWTLIILQQLTVMHAIDVQYLAEISYDGQIETSPFHFMNSTRTIGGTSYDASLINSLTTVNLIAENIIMVRQREYNDDFSITEDSSYLITHNATTNDTELIRRDYVRYGDNIFKANNMMMIDEDVMVRFSLFDTENIGSEAAVIRRDYLIDPNGSIISNDTKVLNDVSIFSKFRNAEGGYDDLRLFIETRGYFADGNMTYQFLFVHAMESIDDEHRSTRTRVFAVGLISNGENLTVIEYGDEFEPMETKSAFFVTIAIGTIFGLATPISLWLQVNKQLLKRGGDGL